MFFLVCDGLKGLPASVAAVWPDTIVQTCVIHLLRNSFKYVPRQHCDALKRDLKPIYTAVDATAADAALTALDERWGERYPTMIRLWQNAWDEFIPFLDYNIEVRRVLYSTNAIESLNARYRRAVKARGHFPTRAGPESVGRTLEARPERVRDHLRRPHPRPQPRPGLTTPLTPKS